MMNAPEHVPPELIIDFDVYDPPGARTDFHGAWKALQDLPTSFVWTTSNGGHWIAVRGRNIPALMSDYEHFSNRCVMVPRSRAMEIRALPTTLDPPEHKPYRALLNARLTPRIVREMEADIRSVVIDTIETFQSRNGCEFISEFAEVVPIAIFMRMVDLPASDSALIKPWVEKLTRPDGSTTVNEMQACFADYLRPRLAARRAYPADDLLSHLVTGEVNGLPLSDEEAIDMCTQVLVGGMDTVATVLGFIAMFLAQNPGHFEQLRADRNLVPAAVEEFLRRFPIVQSGRLVVKDCVIDDITFKAGDMMIIPTPLHGLDRDQHEAPWEVDFHRQRPTHSTFGHGPHQCPGQMLARAEIKISIEELTARLPQFYIKAPSSVEMASGGVATIRCLPLAWNS